MEIKKNTTRKINIGFDIGITSVGWAIVDEDNNIVSRGVRTFEEVKDPKDGKLANQNRRDKRQLRRIIRRKQNRKLDFIKLISKRYFDIFDIKYNDDIKILQESFFNVINQPHLNDVLSIKIKALKGEISKVELLKILYNYLSHRGYTYLDLEKYEKKEDSINFFKNNTQYLPFIEFIKLKYDSYNKSANKSKENFKQVNNEINIEAEKYHNKDLKFFKSITSFISAAKNYITESEYLEKYPSEIQQEEFNKNGKYRGSTINDNFSIHSWKREIEKILNNQSYLNEQFKKDYLYDKNSIFSRLRDYSQGPGSERSPTNYGLYQLKDGEVKKIGENLWSVLIGKCSVYPNLPRANKNSISSEIANFLSQLNMLLIKNDKRNSSKLLEKEKINIIQNCLIKNKEPKLKLIASLIDVDEKDIFHYPTDQKKESKEAKDKFEKLENSRKLISLVYEFYSLNTFGDILGNIKELNEIIDIFARCPDDIEKQKMELIKKFSNKNNLIESLLRAKIKGQSTASMSERALNEYINDEIKDGKDYGKTINQKYKSIIEENQSKSLKIDASKSNYINFKCLDNEIISPTTKCSFRETIKIFNAILKRFVYSSRNEFNEKFLLNNIVMEMPTEWNSKDERERQNEIKKNNEERKSFVKQNYEYDGTSSKIITKLVLLHRQKGQDIYTGESIDSSKLINDPSYCDIDHIIPYSISYDDSLSNKVLVLNKTNKEKGQRIPFDYLGNGKFYSCIKKWKELYLDDSSNVDKKKYDNLTITKIDANKKMGFIGRNLADTRYACRLANNVFNTWLESMNKANKISLLSDDEINVLTITGRTSQRYARGENYLNIKKDRDLDFSHHAIDATVCAILGNSKTEVGQLVWFRSVDPETGEVKTVSKYKYDHNKFMTNENGNRENVAFNKYENNIKWKDLIDPVLNKPIAYSYKMHKKSNFGFYGDTLISVKKIDNNKFDRYKKINLLDSKDISETNKKIEEIKKYYIEDDKNKYPDPKLLDDILKVYEEGKKLSNIEEYKNQNPFKIYMTEYNKINGTNINDRVVINRNNYIYGVKSLKVAQAINSFSSNKRMNLDSLPNNKKIGVYSGLDWKEIRLFRNKKGDFRVIPIRVNLFDKNFRINDIEYEKLLISENIDISMKNKFILINKGMCMISKDKTDVIKIVGIHFGLNLLDIHPINKPSKQNQVSINTIMSNYNFINLDILGNYWVKEINF